MKEYTDKDLQNIVNGELVFPDKHRELYAEEKRIFKKLGATNEVIDNGIDLCHIEFWYAASELAASLAQTLLDERIDKDHKLEAFIKNIQYELDTLKMMYDQNQI